MYFLFWWEGLLGVADYSAQAMSFGHPTHLLRRTLSYTIPHYYIALAIVPKFWVLDIQQFRYISDNVTNEMYLLLTCLSRSLPNSAMLLSFQLYFLAFTRPTAETGIDV